MMLVWNALDEGQHIVLSMQQQIPQKYTETNGRSGDAVEFYACKKVRHEPRSVTSMDKNN